MRRSFCIYPRDVAAVGAGEDYRVQVYLSGKLNSPTAVVIRECVHTRRVYITLRSKLEERGRNR